MVQLKQKLNTDKYEVEDWKQMMPEIVQHMELDMLTSKIMISILYMIIGFGIYGTVLMMTNERHYEFGVLLSIGMKRWQLALVTWLEVMMIAVIGLLIGSAVSFPLTLYFKFNPIRFTGEYAEIYEEFGFEPLLAFSLEPKIYMMQALTVFLIVGVISLYPIRYLNKLNAVEAMRH